eukprot:2746839-Lingulodinium_polyedra.AAC.1
MLRHPPVHRGEVAHHAPPPVVVLRARVAAPEEVGDPGDRARPAEWPGVKLHHLQLVADAAPVAPPPAQLVEDHGQHAGVRHVLAEAR